MIPLLRIENFLKLLLRMSDLYIFIDPRSFPLTDATSLLMRLQMEPESIGIDLKDRWREVGNMYQSIVETDSTMFIFDDFHALLGCLFGNER